MIAFYYALTGIACVIYWRHELTRSVKNFLFIGVAPLVGAVGLGYLLFESARDLADPKASYSGTELLGVGVPLAIAVAFTVIGLVLMVVWRFSSSGKPFFQRRGFESVDQVADGPPRRPSACRGRRVVSPRRDRSRYDGTDCAQAAPETEIRMSRDLGDELLITSRGRSSARRPTS